MKINEYPSVVELNSSDEFIVNTGGGTKKATLSEIATHIKSSEDVGEVYDIATKHRNTFRGKNLGTSFTDDQLREIQNGTFNDLYVGDYWEINGFTWRIADIDYYMNTGIAEQDKILTKHHLIIIPDTSLTSSKIGEKVDWKYGYGQSYIRTSSEMNQARNIFKASFNDHILTYKNVLINTVNETSGGVDAFAWYDCDIELMSLLHVSNIGAGRFSYCNILDFTMFELFRQNKELLKDKTKVCTWLREGSGNPTQYNLYKGGVVNLTVNRDASNGIRPYALVG